MSLLGAFMKGSANQALEDLKMQAKEAFQMRLQDRADAREDMRWERQLEQVQQSREWQVEDRDQTRDWQLSDRQEGYQREDEVYDRTRGDKREDYVYQKEVDDQYKDPTVHEFYTTGEDGTTGKQKGFVKDGEVVGLLGDSAPISVTGGSKLPANVSEAEWLVANGVAKDKTEAYKMVRSTKGMKPEDKAMSIVEAMIKESGGLVDQSEIEATYTNLVNLFSGIDAQNSPAPAAAPGGYQKGQRAKNPNTGEIVEFDGQNWVPVQS